MTDHTVMVHFDRALIAAMLSDTEPKTVRLSAMGEPNEDGSYTPTWVVEDMDPRMPDPWVFDGYRRIFAEGKALALWQARAVNLSDVEYEEGTGRQKASFLAGQGRTMVEARDALLSQMAE